MSKASLVYHIHCGDGLVVVTMTTEATVSSLVDPAN